MSVLNSYDVTEKAPWLLHMAGWDIGTGSSGSIALKILQDGMLRSAADRNLRFTKKTDVARAENGVGVVSKNKSIFLRLGTPRDIANLYHGVVFALDARALLQYKFQLNVGWGAERGAEWCAKFDGRELTDPALFTALNALNRARNLEFGLNRAPAKAGRKASSFEISNEIMAFRAIPLRPNLRAVFVPVSSITDGGGGNLSQVRAREIRAFVEENYPDVRVIEYVPVSLRPG